ncbi:arsenate reductase ArsC [Candidatus Sumerlaeota bacterium]|nr:arsenate reductase ArsC [Candidatus Sumerlaeota bacterium]
MRRILFVCWANCVRSQIAEALLRYRGAGRFEALSAGAAPVGIVHPFAERVLREIAVPIDGLWSKSWTDFKDEPPDAVITLCDSARDKVCPEWPLSPDSDTLPIWVHWRIQDPLGVETMGETQLLEEFRRTRDEIREHIERLAIACDEVLDADESFARLLNEVAAEVDRA